MGRTCTICAHPELAAIEMALETDRPLRDIAPRFGVSKTALHRHLQAHTSEHAVQTPQRTEISTPERRSPRLWTLARWALVIVGVVLLARSALGRLQNFPRVSDGTAP